MLSPGKAAPPRYVSDRPYAKPEAAGRRLLEHAQAVDNPQGWVHTGKLNATLLYTDGASPAEYRAGIDWLIAEGLIDHHDSGTYFTLTQKAKDLFA